MSAPDLYFGNNAILDHIHDYYEKDVLVDYWQTLGREYGLQHNFHWKSGGTDAIVADWRIYFNAEPGAVVDIAKTQDTVAFDILVCPATKHLKQSGRGVALYFYEHCDHVCDTRAQAAGFGFESKIGMELRQHRYIRLSTSGEA